MFIIDSAFETPDFDYLTDRVKRGISEGIAVRNVRQLHSKLIESQNAMAKTIKEQYGINNCNSPTDILNYFQTVIDEEIATCLSDEEGKWSTRKDNLIPLAMLRHQDAIDILSYRKAKTYAQSVGQIVECLNGDGRIRPKFSLGKTNRINYKEPALMNIPKNILWHVISPRTAGNILISVDIKNQEPWIMINLLGIEKLKRLLNVHGGLYESLFKLIFDAEPTPLERSEFKQAWNALTYGATKFGLKSICKHIDGDKLYTFFSTIPEYKKYSGRAWGLAKKGIRSVSTHFGTELHASESGARLRRVLMDLPIQGTGSDILALLTKHFDDEVEERGIEDSLDIYYSRHDEFIIEVDYDYFMEQGVDAVIATLADIFEHRIDDWEPFQVKIGVIDPGELFISGELYAEEDEDDD